MMFDRSLSIFSIASLNQHIEYFNFRCRIQLDLPVVIHGVGRPGALYRVLVRPQIVEHGVQLREAVGDCDCHGR